MAAAIVASWDKLTKTMGKEAKPRHFPSL